MMEKGTNPNEIEKVITAKEYDVNYVHEEFTNFRSYDLERGSIDVDSYTEVKCTLLHVALKLKEKVEQYVSLFVLLDINMKILYIEEDHKENTYYVVHTQQIDPDDELTTIPVGYSEDKEQDPAHIVLATRRQTIIEFAKKHKPELVKMLTALTKKNYVLASKYLDPLFKEKIIFKWILKGKLKVKNILDKPEFFGLVIISKLADNYLAGKKGFSKNVEFAFQLLNIAATKFKPSPHEKEKLGGMLLQRKDIKGAIHAFRDAGLEYQQLKDFKMAMNCHKKALEIWKKYEKNLKLDFVLQTNIDKCLKDSLLSLFESENKKKKVVTTKLKNIYKISDELRGAEISGEGSDKEIDEESISDIEFNKQLEVEERFFNPRRTKKPFTKNMARKLQQYRLSSTENKDEFDVTGQSTRRLISAEYVTVRASVKCTNYLTTGYGYANHLLWNQALKTKQYRNGYDGQYTLTFYYTHYEKVKLGKTIVEYKHSSNPHYNHVGNYFMESIGDYNDIINFLWNITDGCKKHPNKDNEIAIAKLMLEFTKSGTPISLESLGKINKKITKEEVDKLNRILYNCFVKEVARRVYPYDKEHRIPYATAQARALKLICADFLTLEDVFAKNARYGIFTGSALGKEPKKVRLKVKRINRLYHEAITKPKNHELFIKFFKEHPDGKVISSRKKLHCDLKDVYGGESDTDDEGYTTDEDVKKSDTNSITSV